MRSFRRMSLGIALILSSGAGLADADVSLKPDHPDRYVVQRGDTLWDISGRFLREPWRWPEIWDDNPQIRDPHWIYPGDVLTLRYVDGRPRLALERSGATTGAGRAEPGTSPCAEPPPKRIGGTIKLEPRVRCEPLPPPIPAIPVDAIRPFLERHVVASAEEINAAPYLVDFVEEHIAGSPGDRFYARSIMEADHPSFVVVRPGNPYRDPETGAILAYEATFVGDASLERTGDPATLRMGSMDIEALIGDRLLVSDLDAALAPFYPKPPAKSVNGQIISVLNGVKEIGQYQTVVINRGSEDGLERGDVLEALHGGYELRDTVRRGQNYIRPLERSGLLMVYKTFDRVSLALVMHATRPLHVLDTVANPETTGEG